MTKEDKYIKRYKKQWDELEEMILIIKKRGFKTFRSNDFKRYLYLMKSTSHHLAYSRTHFPESQLSEYLNQLSVKSHNYLYTVKKSEKYSLLAYFIRGFPNKVREHKSYIYLATIIFLIGVIVSYLMVLNNNESAGYFLPAQYIDTMDYSMRESGWSEETFPVLSSYVMVNNIGVSFKAFSLGIIGGLPTVYIMFLNGGLMGALSSLVMQNSPNPLYFWALILPHGIIELTAIFIAGGAGLMIGKALLMPGQYSRIHAIIKNAKEAAYLIPGIVVMLILAGLIEGYFTPARISIQFKLIFALSTFILLLLYFGVKPSKHS